MAVLKQRLHRKNSSGTYDTVHLETSAKLVLMSDGTDVETTIADIKNSIDNMGGGAEYTATFSSSGWSEDSNGFQVQSVTVTGLKSSYDISPDVDPVLDSTDPDATATGLAAFACINIFDTGDNTLTAYCAGYAPDADVTVKVRVLE